MAILEITTSVTGLIGVSPRVVYIQTNDTQATVVVAGYLNHAVQEGATFLPGDIAAVSTTQTGNLKDSITNWYQVIHTGLNYSLVADINPGSVLLPVNIGNIAVFTNVLGQIGDSTPTPAVHFGNIVAGNSTGPVAGTFTSFPAASSGVNDKFIFSALTAGGNFTTTLRNSAMGQSSVISIPDPGVATTTFILSNKAAGQTIATGSLSITSGLLNVGSAGNPGTIGLVPTTAANGQFILSAVNAGGAFNTTLANGTMAQSTVFTIPDPTNAIARVLVGATATPFTSGHLLAASGTGGLVADSGITTASVQLKSDVIANSANAGGSGAGPVSVAVAGVTAAASKMVATLASSSNAVQLQTCIATNTGFDVTFTGDPGASAIVNYVIYKVAQ